MSRFVLSCGNSSNLIGFLLISLGVIMKLNRVEIIVENVTLRLYLGRQMIECKPYRFRDAEDGCIAFDVKKGHFGFTIDQTEVDRNSTV